jgi:hypothetical protein
MSSQRSEFASAVYNFFSFLQQETLVTRRAIVRVQEGHKAVKGTTLPDLSTESPCPRYTIISNPEAALDTALQLRQHVLEHWISPGLEMATRRPVARILVALMVLKLYLDAFGQEDGVQEAIFTPKTVEQLLACQGSEFNDVRSKARAMYVTLIYHDTQLTLQPRLRHDPTTNIRINRYYGLARALVFCSCIAESSKKNSSRTWACSRQYRLRQAGQTPRRRSRVSYEARGPSGRSLEVSRGGSSRGYGKDATARAPDSVMASRFSLRKVCV